MKLKGISASLWVSVSPDTKEGARPCKGKTEGRPGALALPTSPPLPRPWARTMPAVTAVFTGARHHLPQREVLQDPPSSLSYHTSLSQYLSNTYYEPDTTRHRGDDSEQTPPGSCLYVPKTDINYCTINNYHPLSQTSLCQSTSSLGPPDTSITQQLEAWCLAQQRSLSQHIAHMQPNHLEPRSCQFSSLNTSPERRQGLT